MRNTTDKKRGAVLCAVIALVFLLAYLALLFCAVLQEAGLVETGRLPLLDAAAAIGLFVLFGLLLAAMAVGVLAALFLRLRELKGGEEEDARKY